MLRFQTVGQQVRVGEQHDWLDAGLLVVHARSGMTERGSAGQALTADELCQKGFIAAAAPR